MSSADKDLTELGRDPGDSKRLLDYARSTQLKKLRELSNLALRQYSITPISQRLLRYEDNAVFEVQTAEGGRYSLRISLNKGRTVTEQSAELYWLASMRGDGLPVPSPQKMADGSYVGRLESPLLEEPATVVLFEWLGGKVCPPLEIRSVAHQLGALTARIHLNASSLSLPAAFSRPHWNPIDLFDNGGALTDDAALRYLDAAGRRIVESAGRRVHASLDPFIEGQHLIHADLHAENALYTPSGEVAIIDFDDCGFGDEGLDIATVISSMNRRSPKSFESSASEFLRAYAEVKELPASLGELPSLLVMRDMVILNFVTSSQNPTVAEWAGDRIRAIIRGLDSFVNDGTYVGQLDLGSVIASHG